MKKIVLSVLAITSISSATCGFASCDGTISYAMGKERDAVRARIDDMIRTLNNTLQETKINNTLMTKGAIQFIRLRERFKIRYVDAEKQNHELDLALRELNALASLQTIKNKTIMNRKEKIGDR